MKFSEGSVKTRRDTNETSKNAELLTRGGFINQLGSGIYTYLPIGLRVLNNIIEIIREEMNAVGGNEVLMPALHPAEYWKKSKRYDVPESYKLKSQRGQDYVLGWTHEEIVTDLATKMINSYKDLPLYLYQIQTKFRDELRAKSGILRSREFLMKDLYSFHTDNDDLDAYYEKVALAYENIFKRVGLGELTYKTYASGGAFSKYSHEFQTVAEAGEDVVYLCEKCKVGINKEIIKDIKVCPECKGKKLKEVKAIEVGNIFKLGTRFSEPYELYYKDEKGFAHPVVMASYGIGPGRLMGTVVEVHNDQRGIVWPTEIAPFEVHLIDLDGKKKEAEEVYTKLTEAGIEVLWDDRDETAGVKFSDADLIGVPLRIVVSEKTVGEGKIEIKERNKKEFTLVSLDKFVQSLTGMLES